MAQTQISDVVVPAEFTQYQIENSRVSTALFRSGVAIQNDEMSAKLNAGAQQFAVLFWTNIPNIEAEISTDNSAVLSFPQKIAETAMQIREAFLHSSWLELSLAGAPFS
jgi:hypothetical protein